MKKVISLFLSLVMLLSITAGLDLSVLAAPDSSVSIKAGETKTVNITSGGDYAYFSFTPEEDGNYVFYSTGDYDTYGYIYDENMDELYSNDDGAKGYNFSIFYYFEKGKTYHFGCRMYNSDETGSFNVSLIENPVKSIEFTPIRPYELIENVNGEWDEYWDDEKEEYVEFWYYYPPDYNVGDKLTVTTKDGTKTDYVLDDVDGDFISANGNVLDWSLYIQENQYAIPWTIDGDNYFTISYMGAEAQVPVTIVENPVKSIEFTPVKPYEIIENTNGEWRERLYGNEEDEQYEKFWCYDTPDYNDGDILTVTTKDGDKTDYIFDYDQWCFISKNGDFLNWHYIHRNNDQYSNPWTVGKDNYFTISYLGAETQVPVTIVENPVKSIEFTPIKPYEIVENTNGDWEEYWYEDEDGNEQCEEYWYYYIPYYNDGDILTVNKKDGSKTDYIFDYDEDNFVSANGDVLDWYYLDYYSYQYSNPWKVGSENYFIIEYMGKICTVPVTIISHAHKWDNGVVTKAATCTEAGIITYTCSVGKETRTEAIPAKGHTWNGGVVATPATCVTPGTVIYTCTTCGGTRTETIPATGHTVVADKAVAATYTATGLTEGSHCSVCGTVIVPQTVVAKKKPTIKKVTKAKKSFKVTWKKVSGITGYEIQYSTSKKFTKKTTKTATVKGAKKTSATVKKLKAKKTYYVRIRTYKTVKGKKVYSSWSAVKNVKTK